MSIFFINDLKGVYYGMSFNPKIYKEENLHAEDKKIVDEINHFLSEILDEEIVDDYCNSKNMGKVESELSKEKFLSFIDYLKTKSDFLLQDLIIRYIEKYDDEELERLNKNV